MKIFSKEYRKFKISLRKARQLLREFHDFKVLKASYELDYTPENRDKLRNLLWSMKEIREQIKEDLEKIQSKYSEEFIKEEVDNLILKLDTVIKELQKFLEM